MTQLSVVIPAFNSVGYIANTLRALDASARLAGTSHIVVVVDDGSTDGTPEAIETVKSELTLDVRVVQTSNQGAFMARWTGAQLVDTEWVMFLDSRQLVRGDFIGNFAKFTSDNPTINAWCSHVETDPTAPLVGHFWTAPVSVFWGSYWRDLNRTMITPDNFDRVPKGTGGIILKREVFVESCKRIWPESNQKFISDDTKLLRDICATHPIALEPELFSTYIPRVSVKAFLRHAFNRGTLFVDSYMSTSWVRFAIIALLVVAPPFAVITLFAVPPVAQATIAGVILGVFVGALAGISAIALRNHTSIRAVRAFVTFSIPFAVVFWAGLARGIFVHRKSIVVGANNS